jgi:hypothetical protein
MDAVTSLAYMSVNFIDFHLPRLGKVAGCSFAGKTCRCCWPIYNTRIYIMMYTGLVSSNSKNNCSLFSEVNEN